MNRTPHFLFAVIGTALFVAKFKETGTGVSVKIAEQHGQMGSTPSFEGNGTNWSDAKTQADNYLSGQGGQWVNVTTVTPVDGEGSIPIG